MSKVYYCVWQVRGVGIGQLYFSLSFIISQLLIVYYVLGWGFRGGGGIVFVLEEYLGYVGDRRVNFRQQYFVI